MEEYRTKFNNFHGWFPGGFYRVGFFAAKGEKDKALVEDIDNVLKEMSFDIHTYKRLRGGIGHLFREVIDLTKKVVREGNREFTEEEEGRKMELCEEGYLVNKRLDDMMEPVFEKLVEKGHSRRDLTI